MLRSYPHAVAGDLVFVSNKVEGLPIETYQRGRGFPHPEKVHVAVVVSPDDIMEAMVKKTAYSMTFGQWLSSRKRTFAEDLFHILRSPHADVSNTGKIIDAALYYLGEQYALRDAARDTIQETPVRLGYSICSVLAAKILVRSGALDAEVFPLNRQLYPGPLFQLLTELGWYPVDPKTDSYFHNPVPSAAKSPMEIRQAALTGTRKVREQTKIASDIVRILDAQLRSLPLEDAIYAIAGSGNTTTFNYVAERIFGVIYDYASALRQKEQGVRHWKDEETHRPEIAGIAKQALQEGELVLELTEAIVERVKGILVTGQIEDDLNSAKHDLQETGVVQKERMAKILETYLEAEIEFFAATGLQSTRFLETDFDFDFSEVKQSLSEEHEDLEAISERLISTFEAARAYAASKAELIGFLRESVRVVVGEDAMNRITSSLQEQLIT